MFTAPAGATDTWDRKCSDTYEVVWALEKAAVDAGVKIAGSGACLSKESDPGNCVWDSSVTGVVDITSGSGGLNLDTGNYVLTVSASTSAIAEASVAITVTDDAETEAPVWTSPSPDWIVMDLHCIF